MSIDYEYEAERAMLYKRQLEEVREEAARLRVQLAGCSAAALGASSIAASWDYGWSPSYQDVVNLRQDHDRLAALLAKVDPALLRRVAGWAEQAAEEREATWKGVRDWEGQEERRDAAALRALADELEAASKEPPHD